MLQIIIIHGGGILKKYQRLLVNSGKLIACILLLSVIVLSTNVNHIIAGAIPTTSIVDVAKNSTVTIRTYDFPADQDFIVTMGKFKTRGIAGYVVTTLSSGAGGSFDVTLTIPAALYDLDKIAVRFESAEGYYAYDWFNNNDHNVPSENPVVITTPVKIPTTSIKSVEPGVSVTIITYDFPAEQTFAVTMGDFGTRGVGGISVANTYSGSGGSFEVTYTIPTALVDNEKIAIRLESPEGFYTYDWFVNTENGSKTAGYSGIPTTSIKSVDPGVSVTVTTYNFPANVDFNITMGEYGTQGVNGTSIKTINSGTGGSFDVEIIIPTLYVNEHLLAIRFQSSGPYYAYDWFVNQPEASPTIPNADYIGIPTTSIKSVDPGVSVTITTHNYPANIDFNITMGEFGTKGVGGTYIKTINSGTGGTFDVVCFIPAAIKSYDKIAIRFQSAEGYFSYDWFSNQ